MSVFNRCIETGNVLLILECWQDVHPALVSIPVKWEYSSPYGLLYALNPPDDVMQFENNEATKRVVMYSAKHVIKRHKKEIQVNRLHFTTLLYCLIMRQ